MCMASAPPAPAPPPPLPPPAPPPTALDPGIQQNRATRDRRAALAGNRDRNIVTSAQGLLFNNEGRKKTLLGE